MKDRKRVCITGGSSGIGLGLARVYAKMGDDILLLARDEARLQAALAECRELAADPNQVIAALSVDVTAHDSLAESIEAAVTEYGLPDLLILSAGIAGNKTFLDTSGAEFDRIVDINLGGSREVARAVLPAMLQRGSGQIAFVSSTAGLMGIYGYSAYSASKFAVTGLCQALRQELVGTGVSVHLVCPSEVNTPMVAAESLAPVPQTRFLKDLVGTMEPDVVARKIARGIRRRRATVIPGVRAGVIVWIARHFPQLFASCSDYLLRWKFK